MFSCLGKLGCLALALLLAAAAWFTHDAWYPALRARLVAPPPPVAEAAWEPLTPAAAARGRAAAERLSERSGPVYVNVAAGDFAAFLLDSVLASLSASASGAEALARDDRLYLRARASVAELGGSKTLGPLSGVITGRQTLTLRGRLEVLRPGRAQFVVDEVAIGELRLPSAAIPRLIARVAGTARDSANAPEAVLVKVPRTLADVRVGKGRVTLYKNVP
ncbi:MAG TPA: hypothetical protein VJL28_04110 [Gemmatimonadaceae bacterium]|nr:hypothetical protein [Gemmatimonadaceae bacterium]